MHGDLQTKIFHGLSQFCLGAVGCSNTQLVGHGESDFLSSEIQLHGVLPVRDEESKQAINLPLRCHVPVNEETTIFSHIDGP